MRTIPILAAAVLSLGPATIQAQDGRTQWEAGAAGGFGFSTSRDVTAGGATASAGFKPGVAVGGYLGHNNHPYIGGEIRYTYQKNNLKLESGGTETSFGAQSHAVHYDLLVHGAPMDAAVRPFVSVGGGIRHFQGTGTEQAFQPLSQFAILTKTSEVKGMVSVGGGVKFRLSDTLIFRIDVRDYMSPMPKQVIAPGRNASLGGWVHNIVPTAGISLVF